MIIAVWVVQYYAATRLLLTERQYQYIVTEITEITESIMT